MKSIMIVGASGVFGSRLVEQLAVTGTYDLILAGRDARNAADLMATLKARNSPVRFEVFDRRKPNVARLLALAPLVIVDAAGPFQNSPLALAEAAIAAGAHYIDLADARDFVARIHELSDRARAAGVTVISGASSTPALSHAVIDHMVRGWVQVDSILVAISPGNRAPRGLSVVAAILSRVGEPIKVFREGRMAEAFGWSLNERFVIAGVGIRPVALCDTPDLDLLVSRYAPRIAAEFKAGLELGVMHRGLRLLGFLRSRKFLPPLALLARPIRFIASLLDKYGSDRGGMFIRVTGKDGKNQAVRACWSLAAGQGVGPTTPALPALALIQRIAAGGTLVPGAYAAAGHVHYDEMLSHLNRLGIETQMSVEVLPTLQLFERALGTAWQSLPEITRRIHLADPSVILAGEAQVEGAENAAGRFIARIFGFPEAARNVPVRVVIEGDGEAEQWARHYPTRTMRSVMTAPDPARSTVEEHMGPFHFRLKLLGSPEGIDLVPEAVSFRGLPLPLWVLPAITATERASADGRHLFNVHVSLAPFGRLVHYRGWLKPVAVT